MKKLFTIVSMTLIIPALTSCGDGIHRCGLFGRQGRDVQRIGFLRSLRFGGRGRERRYGGHTCKAVFFHTQSIVV